MGHIMTHWAKSSIIVFCIDQHIKKISLPQLWEKFKKIEVTEHKFKWFSINRHDQKHASLIYIAVF